MTKPGRKYGARKSYPISVWNGIFDHHDKIGEALWEFLWCLDRITKEVDGVGWVLGKSPIKVRDFISSIKGSSGTSVRRHLKTLERYGYIHRTRTPYGFVILVQNSQKVWSWIAKENVQSGRSQDTESVQSGRADYTKVDDQCVQSGRNKEEKAVEKAKIVASELWTLLGTDPSKLRPPFKKHCEDLFSAKNGQPMGDFVTVCMDSWELLGNKIPAPFAQAVKAFREREKNPPPAPITFLPDVPFKKRNWSMEELCPKQS